MVKVLIIIVLVLVVGFLAVQAFHFSQQEADLTLRYRALQADLQKATMARDELQEKLENYDRPENIEQAVREQFNYRRPDEKMLIIVPPHESTSSNAR